MNFFLSLFIIYFFTKTSSKIISVNINTNINWLYLTKFSFHPINGYIDINTFDPIIKLFVFNKQEWGEIKKDLSKICLKKEFILNQTNLWISSSSFIFIDPTYFILSKCNSTLNRTDLTLTYKLILTNGENLFNKHFSNDERGVLELFIVSTIIYTIILLIILRYIYLFKNKFCLIIKLFLMSIIFSWLYCLITLIYSLRFGLTGSIDGIIFPVLKFFDRFFYLTSQVLFLLVLILCAKGYLIIYVQLKKRITREIIVVMLIYILIQFVILIIITIFADRIFVNEKIFLICNFIQLTMYLLTCLWFLISLLFTIKKSPKKFHFFFIFYLWFLSNAIVILLKILDVLPNPQITILKTIEIGIQYLTYCTFTFVIRNETFFSRTKLNQINITYIDPTFSNSRIQVQSTKESELDINQRELTNLCAVENFWTSRLRWPIRPSESLPRLEPRRDVSLRTSTKSPVTFSQPSICPVPRRLTPLTSDDQ